MHQLHRITLQHHTTHACSHLCSFREYIFAFFSCISWDFSEFAALLSMYAACSKSERKRETKKRSKGDLLFFSFFFFLVLQELPGWIDRSGVRLSSLDAVKSEPRPHFCDSKRINSFIAVLRRGSRRKPHAGFYLVFNWVGVVASNMKLQLQQQWLWTLQLLFREADWSPTPPSSRQDLRRVKGQNQLIQHQPMCARALKISFYTHITEERKKYLSLFCTICYF